MLKTLILLVVLSLSIVHCIDDEFAEFDDFAPEDRQQKNLINDPTQTQPNKLTEKPAAEGLKEPKLPGAGNDGIPKSTKVKLEVNNAEGTTQKKPDLKLVNVPSIKQFRVESYYIEVAFILATFLYLLNFFLGSAKNFSLAQECYEQLRDILKQQFVLVGGSPTLNDGSQKRDEDSEALLASMKKQRGLIKSSEALFTVWNSGRVGMDGLLIEINLLKRQDLFSMALNLIKISKDNLTLRFLLGQEGYENFVFCLAHRTQATRLIRDTVDINIFCPKRKALSQCGFDIEKLVIMSELGDVTSFILDPKTINFLKKHEKSINFIHITDQYSTDKSDEASPMHKLAHPKRMATFSFSFPRNAEDRAEFIHFSLNLLDRLRRFKMARDSKQKSDKNRQKITDFLQKTAFSLRQEAAQAKKEELRRLEKERIYQEDDPEKQRRWEKLEAKREQKKNKMRVKQLKVKSM